MQLLRADANLCAQPELSAIGETGGGVVIDTCSIHFREAATGGLFILSYNAFAMTRSIASDMLERFVQAIDDLHRHAQGEKFGAK